MPWKWVVTEAQDGFRDDGLRTYWSTPSIGLSLKVRSLSWCRGACGLRTRLCGPWIAGGIGRRGHHMRWRSCRGFGARVAPVGTDHQGPDGLGRGCSVGSQRHHNDLAHRVGVIDRNATRGQPVHFRGGCGSGRRVGRLYRRRRNRGGRGLYKDRRARGVRDSGGLYSASYPRRWC